MRVLLMFVSLSVHYVADGFLSSSTPRLLSPSTAQPLSHFTAEHTGPHPSRLLSPSASCLLSHTSLHLRNPICQREACELLSFSARFSHQRAQSSRLSGWRSRKCFRRSQRVENTAGQQPGVWGLQGLTGLKVHQYPSTFAKCPGLALTALGSTGMKTSDDWVLSNGENIELPKRQLVRSRKRAPRKQSILDLRLAEEYFQANGMPGVHLQSLYRWLFRSKQDISWDKEEFPRELSAAVKTAVARDFVLTTSRLVERVESDSGGFKMVIELSDGQLIETVVIKHHHRTSDKTRFTVCVSSQVGCAKGCKFCATGTMGWRGDLSAGEIAEQVWHAREALRQEGIPMQQLRNIVFMGMGEPLANYDEVFLAVRSFTHQSLFDLSAKHITISTVGDSPDRIRDLADEAASIKLAISLHSAQPSIRNDLMPATAGPEASLRLLSSALDYHTSKSGNIPMIEYLLIKGFNDSPFAAEALAQFCLERMGADARQHCLLNLIPYNPTSIGDLEGYLSPNATEVENFRCRLKDLGVGSLVRWTSASGRDADGACGQLVIQRK